MYGTSANPPAEVTPPAGEASMLDLPKLSLGATSYSFFEAPRPPLPPPRPPFEPFPVLGFLFDCAVDSAASGLTLGSLMVMSSEG